MDTERFTVTHTHAQCLEYLPYVVYLWFCGTIVWKEGHTRAWGQRASYLCIRNKWTLACVRNQYTSITYIKISWIYLYSVALSVFVLTTLWIYRGTYWSWSISLLGARISQKAAALEIPHIFRTVKDRIWQSVDIYYSFKEIWIRLVCLCLKLWCLQNLCNARNETLYVKANRKGLFTLNKNECDKGISISLSYEQYFLMNVIHFEWRR